MKRLREYLKERNIPEDSLEANSILEGYEKGYQDAIEKACVWITEHIDIPYEGEFIDDSPVASDYVEYLSKRLEYAKAVADAFKQAMEEYEKR